MLFEMENLSVLPSDDTMEKHMKNLDNFLNTSGYLMEQWLEGLHVIFNDCRRSYLNQKGILRVQYMIDKIFLITSPKYLKSYTNGKSNK